MDMNNHKTGKSNTKRITNERKKGRRRMRSMEWRGHGSARTTLAPQGDSREDKKDVE